MSYELKPCPFCGGEASKRLFYGGRYGIRCDNCGSRVGVLFDTEAEAIEAWNARHRETCGLIYVKAGAMYDVWRCSKCGYERAEIVSEEGVASNYCPNCGAEVRWVSNG